MAVKIKLDPEVVRRIASLEQQVRDLSRRFPSPAAQKHRTSKPAIPPNILFRVKLTQTGGSAGTASTAVSFTYTVKTLADLELATAKAPEWPSRSENGLKTAATQGLAYYGTDGALVLCIAFEKSGTGTCP